MDPEIVSARDLRNLERMARTIVEVCVRNTGLEDLHAGRFPVSRTGDFSDVVVITPEGEIPWTELSRVSDSEMKALMIEIVDRVFTYFRYPEALAHLQGGARWDRPKLDENLMRTVRRRLQEIGAASPGPEDPAPDA